MKKLLFIIITITFFSIKEINVHAQDRPTLQETKDWIGRKLINYTTELPNPGFDYIHPTIYRSYCTDFSITIDANNLILNYGVEMYGDQMYGRNTHYQGWVRITIPICYIDNSKGSKSYIWEINTTIECIKIEREYFNIWEEGDPRNPGEYNYNKIYLASSISLGIEIEREENLAERLKKAFENLQYYYPKPKNTETF